jgi:hypothetical protein
MCQNHFTVKNHIIFNRGEISTRYNCICILLLFILKIGHHCSKPYGDCHVIKSHSHIQVHPLVLFNQLHASTAFFLTSCLHING